MKQGMGRKFAVSYDDRIKILAMIDSGTYTQKQIASIFDISPGTVSRYNNVWRYQWECKKQAARIALLNGRVKKLKERFNLPLEEDEKAPDDFGTCMFCVSGSNDYILEYADKDGLTEVYGYIAESRLDSKEFQRLHPEYHLYTIVTGETDEPLLLRSNYRATKSNIYGYFLSRADMGFIGAAMNQVTIMWSEIHWENKGGSKNERKQKENDSK